METSLDFQELIKALDRLVVQTVIIFLSEGSGDNSIYPVDPNYNPNYDPNANNDRPSDLNFIEGKERSEVE